MFENVQIQKKVGWTVCFVSMKQKLYTYSFVQTKLQYSTYFCLELQLDQKRRQKVCPAFVKHPENKAYRFSDCLQIIWFKRFYWSLLLDIQW